MDVHSRLLVTTTFAHMCALFWPLPPEYASLVVISTALSVLWHASEGPATEPLGILDHQVALLWAIADCYYLVAHRQFFEQMLALNAATWMTNLFVNWLDRVNLIPYYIGHSAWNLVSALKAFYVAALISATSRNSWSP